MENTSDCEILWKHKRKKGGAFITEDISQWPWGKMAQQGSGDTSVLIRYTNYLQTVSKEERALS